MNPFHNIFFVPLNLSSLFLELFRRSSTDLIWPHQGKCCKIYTMNLSYNTLLFYPLALELYRRSSTDLIWPHQGISRVNAEKIYTMNPFHNTLLFYPLALELYRRSSIDLIWPHQGISRVNAAKIYTMNPFHYISCATLLLFSFSRTFPTSSTFDPPILLGPTRVNTAKIYTTIPFHNISCVTIIFKKMALADRRAAPRRQHRALRAQWQPRRHPRRYDISLRSVVLIFCSDLLF